MTAILHFASVHSVRLARSELTVWFHVETPRTRTVPRLAA
jgi:hypothetical protein